MRSPRPATGELPFSIVAASDHNHEPTLRAFADELRDVMLRDGWSADPTSSGSATGFPTILERYSKAVTPGYEATVEFMLESLPVVSFGCAPAGVSAGLSVGGEIGIRHLPTQQLLMELGEAADAGSVTRDLEEIYGDNDQALPTIASPSERALVARQLACTAAGEALTFARGHADIDALLSHIRSDGISTRSSCSRPRLSRAFWPPPAVSATHAPRPRSTEAASPAQRRLSTSRSPAVFWRGSADRA
jgi:hypothetical protein